MKKSFLLTILLGLFFIMPAFASIEDDATVLYNKGIDLYEQDKIEQSIATFKKAISINPEFYEAYYNLARIQESVGKYQDAILSYEALLKLEPKDYESIYQYSNLLYKKGYLAKAQNYLSKIPAGDEFGAKAKILSDKITKRQSEIQEESRVKAAQSIKTSIVGSVPAPSGLVIDSNGNMIVASFSQSTIFKISSDGLNKFVFAGKEKGIDGPIGIAIDSFDNIYVANYNKGNVVCFDKKGNPNVLMYVKKPYCINLDEKNSKIYVTEQQNNSVISYDISDILKLSSVQKQEEMKNPETKQEEGIKAPEHEKVITFPTTDRNPIGTPSIIESNFTRTDPQTSITAPIMVPAGSLFDY